MSKELELKGYYFDIDQQQKRLHAEYNRLEQIKAGVIQELNELISRNNKNTQSSQLSTDQSDKKNDLTEQ